MIWLLITSYFTLIRISHSLHNLRFSLLAPYHFTDHSVKFISHSSLLAYFCFTFFTVHSWLFTFYSSLTAYFSLLTAQYSVIDPHCLTFLPSHYSQLTTYSKIITYHSTLLTFYFSFHDAPHFSLFTSQLITFSYFYAYSMFYNAHSSLLIAHSFFLFASYSLSFMEQPFLHFPDFKFWGFSQYFQRCFWNFFTEFTGSFTNGIIDFNERQPLNSIKLKCRWYHPFCPIIIMLSLFWQPYSTAKNGILPNTLKNAAFFNSGYSNNHRTVVVSQQSDSRSY